MKKLKRFTLTPGVQVLDEAAQMNVLGGNDDTNVCHSKTKENCSGECVDSDGYSGYCGWTGKEWKKCTCAVAFIG